MHRVVFNDILKTAMFKVYKLNLSAAEMTHIMNINSFIHRSSGSRSGISGALFFFPTDSLNFTFFKHVTFMLRIAHHIQKVGTVCR